MHAGVIPFIALSPPVAASLPLIPSELLQNAALLQVAYGASIASFLGGIHWAMAMAEYGGESLLHGDVKSAGHYEEGALLHHHPLKVLLLCLLSQHDGAEGGSQVFCMFTCVLHCMQGSKQACRWAQTDMCGVLPHV